MLILTLLCKTCLCKSFTKLKSPKMDTIYFQCVLKFKLRDKIISLQNLKGKTSKHR